MLYQAQAQAFKEKGKGMWITAQVAKSLLRYKNDQEDIAFPVFGALTKRRDYDEVMYIRSMASCTVADLTEYRNRNKRRKRPQRSSKNEQQRKGEVSVDGATLKGSRLLSPTAQSLHDNVAKSHEESSSGSANAETSPTSKKLTGFRTNDEKDIYVSWKKTMEDGKERALKHVSDMIRHNVFGVESKKELQRMGEQLNEDFVNRVTES